MSVPIEQGPSVTAGVAACVAGHGMSRTTIRAFDRTWDRLVLCYSGRVVRCVPIKPSEVLDVTRLGLETCQMP